MSPATPPCPQISYMEFQRPKGTRDILPEEQIYFERLQGIYRSVRDFYGFGEISTPIIEQSALFRKSIGQGTDIIEKEMYSFTTKGGDSLTLRPEGTAPIARAYIENGLKNRPHPLKLSYWGPMFRHDNPQAGRYRQFHQFGFEIIGSHASIIDTLLILIPKIILEDVGIKSFIVGVNSIGCKECRPGYIEILQEFLRSNIRKFGAEARLKISRNPLRVFDIKDENIRRIVSNAPQIVDHLCARCKKHFEQTLELLDATDTPYMLDPLLVRGLDYYSRTVFEIWPLDGNNEPQRSFALCAGGRYDSLIHSLGGRDVPAVGVAGGIERIIEQMKSGGMELSIAKPRRIFLAHLGDEGKRLTLKLMEILRKANMPFSEAVGKSSLQAQLRVARRIRSQFVVIVAHKEALKEKVILRDAREGTQDVISVDRLVDEIKKRQKNYTGKPIVSKKTRTAARGKEPKKKS